MTTLHKTSLDGKTPPVLTPEEYYEKNGTLMIPYINHQMMTMGGIDLSILPPLVRKFLLNWLFAVNKRRLDAGMPLLVTYDILRQCPIWKVVDMPFRKIKLDKASFLKALSKLPASTFDQNKIKSR